MIIRLEFYHITLALDVPYLGLSPHSTGLALGLACWALIIRLEFDHIALALDVTYLDLSPRSAGGGANCIYSRLRE